MSGKLQLAYVLVSSEKDNYLEEAYVSMYSAKYQMPDVKITLVVDDKTEKSFTGVRKEEVKYADKIVAIPFDEKYDGKRRSRILKTSLRNLIDGDYLFIDTDTIVVKPLYEITEIKADISAVYDLHSTYYKDCFTFETGVAWGNKMGWHLENTEHYFNSGVMYVKDNDVTRAFYKKWNENIMACFEKGATIDQPSLAHTNETFGNIINPLDDVWNCQITCGMQYFLNAKIIHYLCSRDPKMPLFSLRRDDLILRLKQTGEINDEIKMVVENPQTGLAPCIFSLCGDDFTFLQSRLCQYLRSKYGTNYFNRISSFFLIIQKIENVSKKLFRKGSK